MKTIIASSGIISPASDDPEELARMMSGQKPPDPSWIQNPFSGERFPVHLVPNEQLAEVSRLPRVRRSSKISLFALAAARKAWEPFASRHTVARDRVGLVFSTSDGGVIYTRKFFSAIADNPEGVASPLLFPETVYNAPASHVAAILGVEGVSTTVVGDATSGFTALETGSLMLQADQADAVIVVAAEETDWILSQAYALWGLAAAEAKPGHGVVFSEGGAAVVLSRGASGTTLEGIATSRYSSPKDRSMALSQALATTGTAPPFDLYGGAGTQRSIRLEQKALKLAGLSPEHATFPKLFLGDSLAVGTLTALALAANDLQKNRSHTACITAIGFTGQCGAASLRQISS